ncbi:hypothetical protein C5167_022436 [Papaver somniferum]|uniref:Uncharacterized protein n=1 Tax=Papaver somniferum TaxID=3469 RepID=A0A4Y7JJF0_PAPSO|nr:hypothetical protein C5167_022436 [Papaver somniferum]
MLKFRPEAKGVGFFNSVNLKQHFAENKRPTRMLAQSVPIFTIWYYDALPNTFCISHLKLGQSNLLRRLPL